MAKKSTNPSTAARKRMPDSSFGLPKDKAYPIHDAAHARNALARAAQNATPAEQAQIKRRVKSKYPSIDQGK